MECKCNDCGIVFDYEYKISICDDCLLEYNGKEFDVICNKCKQFIKTIKRSFTINNWLYVYKKIRNKKDYCNSCYM